MEIENYLKDSKDHWNEFEEELSTLNYGISDTIDRKEKRKYAEDIDGDFI
jgi:hypothetical protein